MKKLVFLISVIIIMSFSVSIGLYNILTNPDSNSVLAEGTTQSDEPENNSSGEVSSTENATEKNSDAVTETTTVNNENTYDEKVIEIVNSMSVDEKINQLFFVTPEALTGVGTATVAGNTTKQSLTAHPVGGIIYFTQNFQNSAQAKALVSKTKAMGDEVCKVPLFVGVDEEGGKVARLGNSSTISVPKLSNMSEIGKSGDSTKAYEVGKTIGTYLSEYGFNLDFAPVADVLTNNQNQVVKERSFGSDPNICSDMTYQVSKGLNELGILSCYKHFPGHGATTDDTHEGFAYTDKTYEEMEKDELVPFINAIKNNADFIMVGHISAPKVIGDNTPSSISSVMITDILKNKLGFKGVVITDALNMGALTTLYKSDEIAVKAINAGVDMLLMPEDFNLAYNGVKNAVSNGTISEERLNEAVTKIVNVKMKLNK